MAIKTGNELASACMDVAKNHKTLYIKGCFGAPLTAANKKRYTSNHSYNKKAARKKKINAASPDTHGFDCVNLIKGLLWGWNGDKSHTYGGSKYKSNGVPDISADQMIKVCRGVSTDFSTIQNGEAVWLPGHIGVYVGNGLVVESSPKWADGVQITAMGNTPHPSGHNVRSWTKHGKLPYISYTQQATGSSSSAEPTKKEEFDVKVTVLKRGDKGPDVKAFQCHLIGYGYSCGSSGADGSFGPATESALKKYQKDHGLVQDGIRGPATFRSMNGL